MKQVSCMICGSTKLEPFLDLGLQPNGNEFPDAEGRQTEVRYPLSMSVCLDCWLVQLDDLPSAELLFRNHPYITGLNAPIVQHFNNLSKHVVQKFEIPQQSLVIDIGANDGTLLDSFRKLNMRTLGVDPGQRTGKLARAKGITVCETFWNEATGRGIRDLNLVPSLITATAVFYHVPDLHEFVRGLAAAMDDTTVFATQCVYVKRVLESAQFDHFYHEHTCLYSLRPLQKLFSQHGMRLLDVEFYDVHGGSFILYVGKEENRIRSTDRIAQAIEREQAAGLFELETYRRFTEHVNKNCRTLVDLLTDLKKQQKTVYALGAPVKGSTLMNYCNIGPDLVSCAVEINQFKIGKFTPGTHIPVISEEQVQRPPDYYLVLAWNFVDHFLQTQVEYLRNGGKFILPHPTVAIADLSGTTVWSPGRER